LISTYFKENLVFNCSGQHNGKTSEQLANFTEQLNKYFPTRKQLLAADSWQKAFNWLTQSLDTLEQKGKKVLFFDELPWLDSHKSGFLSSFSYFWNMYASRRGDLLVVICGSAASWMIEKILNNKGGLHNRVTQRIRLLPFSLKETEQYLLTKNIKLEHYQLLQLYMVMGGVPAYLNAVQRGESAAQTIERCCFTKDGVLTSEFDNLYAALFNTPEKHIQVIQALSKKNKGLTREELLQTAKLASGGGVTTVLHELTESGFIEKIYPYGKKERDTLYRLTDEFSLFYFRFMQDQKGYTKGQWVSRQSTPSFAGWSGYAFENICIKHSRQIKEALQIAGIHSSESSWRKTGKDGEKGAQIDLLLDRADHCINVCEIKFSQAPFIITKKYASELQNKLQVFRQNMKERKALLLTMVTTYGVAENEYKAQLIDNEVTMEALFG
jgi:hypothetical protein